MVPSASPATDSPQEKKYKANVTEHTLSVTSVKEKRRIIQVLLFLMKYRFPLLISYGLMASSMAPVAS